LGLVLVLCAAMPMKAFAHAVLESSSPHAGDSVPGGTVALEFHFNSRIDRGRSRLILMQPDHNQVPLKIIPAGPPEVLSSTVTLAPGDYTVRWQVLAVDGHITRGDVGFTVTGP
jgi:copper resistance protein C